MSDREELQLFSLEVMRSNSGWCAFSTSLGWLHTFLRYCSAWTKKYSWLSNNLYIWCPVPSWELPLMWSQQGSNVPCSGVPFLYIYPLSTNSPLLIASANLFYWAWNHLLHLAFMWSQSSSIFTVFMSPNHLKVSFFGVSYNTEIYTRLCAVPREVSTYL